MSYAERDFATVPAAAPAWKNQRTTSCPAPISANVPYFASSRLTLRAFRFVVNSSVDSIGFSGKNRFLLYQERNHQLSSRNDSGTGAPIQKDLMRSGASEPFTLPEKCDTHRNPGPPWTAQVHRPRPPERLYRNWRRRFLLQSSDRRRNSHPSQRQIRVPTPLL